MKIRTDLNEILPRKNTPVTPQLKIKQPEPPAETRKTDAEQNQLITARLQQERTLTDALAIAQMSQSLIQKAITVSTTLSNIASEAMRSGRINNNELTNTMTEINAAFRKDAGAALPQIQAYNPVIPAAPRIDEEISALSKFAENLTQGGEMRMQDLTAVLEGLNKKAASAGHTVNELETSLEKVFDAYPDAPNAGYQNLTGVTAKAILANADRALMAQGNVSRDNARAVMG